MQRIVVQRRAVGLEMGILELLVIFQGVDELPFSYASLIIGLVANIVLGEGAGVEGAGHVCDGAASTDTCAGAGLRSRRAALSAALLCVFECRVSQTRPGTRPQRSEVFPDGWDAVVASFLFRSRDSRESTAQTQRLASQVVREGGERKRAAVGTHRSRRASAIEVGLPGRADGAATQRP